ncbi:MAG: hypothetical protein V3V08_00560, partial [Nannocystaceae bacterium]
MPSFAVLLKQRQRGGFAQIRTKLSLYAEIYLPKIRECQKFCVWADELRKYGSHAQTNTDSNRRNGRSLPQSVGWQC